MKQKHERTKRTGNIQALKGLPPHHLKVMGDALHSFIATRPEDPEQAFAAVQLMDDVRAAEAEIAQIQETRRQQVSYLVATS